MVQTETKPEQLTLPRLATIWLNLLAASPPCRPIHAATAIHLVGSTARLSVVRLRRIRLHTIELCPVRLCAIGLTLLRLRPVEDAIGLAARDLPAGGDRK